MSSFRSRGSGPEGVTSTLIRSIHPVNRVTDRVSFEDSLPVSVLQGPYGTTETFRRSRGECRRGRRSPYS